MMGLIEIDQDKRMSAINHFLKAQKYYLEDALLFTIMGYFKMNNKVKVDEYLEILMENTNHPFYKKIGMYYQIKMNDNMYELREYINKNLLQTMKKVEYDYFYDQVMNDLIKFHRFNSRYKAVDELRHKMSDKR
jgi:hypothetical protein